MENTRKHFLGNMEKTASHAHQQHDKTGLCKKAWTGLFGKDKPLWLKLTKSAVLLTAIAVVAIGVVAITMQEDSPAYAAQKEQPEVVVLQSGDGNWKDVDLKQGLMNFSNQEEEQQNYYTVGTQDAEMMTAIHSRLMELGYMDSDEPSPAYTETTAQAVKLFERKNGFEMDGILTQYEYDLLMSDEVAPYSVSLGDEGTDVSELQKRLVELGYLEDVTGEFGIYTQKAVKAFQQANNLTADGTIGTQTREMLYSDQAVAKALSYGDEAEIIKTYQQKLKELNYYNGAVDGFFSSELRDAVKAFQNKNGLIADGAIGNTTAQILMSEQAQPSSYSLGDSGDMVTKIQERLIELKYMTGATGYFGEHTETAVKRFQQLNGLSVDGKIGEKTMEVLFSDSAKKYTSSSSSSGSSSSGSSSSGGSSSGGSSSGSSSSGSSSSGSGSSVTNPPAGDEATDSADSSKVEQFIAVAKTKLGCKYVLGAKGPDTFDCSGFVYWCLKQVGVNQSYMTSAGWKATTKYPIVTSMSELEKGDIISYEGHVGIYIGGNQMIDASSSEGKVRITNIYSVSYWTEHFIKGCRIF